MHNAIELATELRGLLGLGSMALWQGATRSVLLRGSLSLSHDDVYTAEVASVTIEIPEQWRIIPPLARSFEPWIKRGVDWHATSSLDGVLCYVFDGHWRYHLENLRHHELDKPIAHYAAKWCVNSLSWLLYRHLYAHEHRQIGWNPAWGGWPHGPADAWREFENLKKRHAI